MAFSPDGTRIASAGRDSTIRLWNAQSGQQEGVLTGHEDAVTAVAFTPDGHHLASGGIDGTVRIWDVDTGKPSGYSMPAADW